MIEQLRYITDEQGDRVGVVLGLDEYARLRSRMKPDPELLIGMERDELQALAEGMLAPVAQKRLDELLARNAEIQLSVEEDAELDQILAQVDHLTILKTRAKYTLQNMDQ